MTFTNYFNTYVSTLGYKNVWKFTCQKWIFFSGQYLWFDDWIIIAIKFTWNFVKIGRTIKLEFWIVPKANWHGRKRFCTDKFSRLVHWNGTIQISIPTFNCTTQHNGLDFTPEKKNNNVGAGILHCFCNNALLRVTISKPWINALPSKALFLLTIHWWFSVGRFDYNGA